MQGGKLFLIKNRVSNQSPFNPLLILEFSYDAYSNILILCVSFNRSHDIWVKSGAEGIAFHFSPPILQAAPLSKEFNDIDNYQNDFQQTHIWNHNFLPFKARLKFPKWHE